MIKPIGKFFLNAFKLILLVFFTFYAANAFEYEIDYSQRSTKALINNLHHRVEEIREKSFDELEKRGKNVIEPLIRALKYRNLRIRRHVFALLSKIKDPRCTGIFLKALKESDWKCHAEAFFFFKHNIDSNLEILIDSLKSGDLDLKLNILNIFASSQRYFNYTGNYRVIDPIMALLKEDSPIIKVTAIYALRHYKIERVIKGIIDISRDNNLKVRLDAITTLGEIDSPLVLEPLAANLSHSHWKVRMEALISLRKRRDKGTAVSIIKCLYDKDWRVRYHAVRALASIHDQVVVGPLEALLNDKDKLIRRIAVYALGESQQGDAIKGLVKTLEMEDPVSRYSAVISLGKVGKPASGILIKIMLNKKYHCDLRRLAIKELANLKEKNAVAQFIQLLKDLDSDIRREVLMALEKIKDRRSFEPIRDVSLNDHDSDIRRIAKEVYEKIIK
jgi:HEAT repeat protein